MATKHRAKLVASIGLCQLAGLVPGVFVWPALPVWYANLTKPMYTPPGWVFGPVWWLLYTLMGIAFYLIWKSPVKAGGKRESIFLFFLHLLTNAGWVFIFFGQRHLPLAFVDLLLLVLMVTILIYKFYPISRTASLLLLPYLAWVTFAAYLNYGLLSLNSSPF